ncbi:MAG: alpha/beta hydrolase [Bacteroidales bacterium]|nr:alpha/beta hydrolase [Bacteroidales bacterium]
MKTDTFWFKGVDDLDLFVYKWTEETNPKAILLLVHGSVEHALRYTHFAEKLTQSDYLVFAPDMRGHGKTAEKSGLFSYMADKDGWELSVQDLWKLSIYIKEKHPGIPFYIFGHSMGSFLVRDYISRYGDQTKAAVITGSTLGQPILARTGLLLSKILRLFNNQQSKSPFFHKMLYGNLNAVVPNPRTEVDFISRDSHEVDKYIKDPWCGCTVTIEYATQLALGSLNTAKPTAFRNTPNKLPIYILSGTDDPVGGHKAKDVIDLVEQYQKYGSRKVELKLYEGARHELLNESNKDEIMLDIIQWMDKQLIE